MVFEGCGRSGLTRGRESARDGTDFIRLVRIPQVAVLETVHRDLGGLERWAVGAGYSLQHMSNSCSCGNTSSHYLHHLCTATNQVQVHVNMALYLEAQIVSVSFYRIVYCTLWEVGG
jgi:hypothetical protein